MPYGKVTVSKPLGRLIYINGNYDEAAGKSPAAFTVEYGPNRFETLTGAGKVDYAADVTVNAANPAATVELRRQ